MTVICGMGLSTPLGHNARSTVAAITAGINRYRQVEAVSDLAGEPARASRLTSLQEEDPLQRALVFAREALQDVVAGLDASQARDLPVYVAAPADTELLMSALQDALPPHVSLRWGSNSITAGGRDAGGAALASAVQALESAPMVLVGGLDCLSSGDALARLARDNLLLGDSNPDGRLGGEGAAFLLLSRRETRGMRSLGVLHALASARDSRPFSGERAGAGEGLTAVFARLRESWHERVDQVVMAHSHERFWGSELSLAYLRNVELMPEPMVMRQVSQNLGDCGAASLLIGLACSLVEFDPRPTIRHDKPPRQSALVYASSDDGHVVGAVVHAMELRPRAAQRRRS